MKPENLLHEFWQRSSDACPLETSEAEKQIAEFEEFVKSKKQNETFEDIIDPVLEWMRTSPRHPHTKIIVTSGGAEILEGVRSHN